MHVTLVTRNNFKSEKHKLEQCEQCGQSVRPFPNQDIFYVYEHWIKKSFNLDIPVQINWFNLGVLPLSQGYYERLNLQICLEKQKTMNIKIRVKFKCHPVLLETINASCGEIFSQAREEDLYISTHADESTLKQPQRYDLVHNLINFLQWIMRCHLIWA